MSRLKSTHSPPKTLIKQRGKTEDTKLPPYDPRESDDGDSQEVQKMGCKDSATVTPLQSNANTAQVGTVQDSTGSVNVQKVTTARVLEAKEEKNIENTPISGKNVNSTDSIITPVHATEEGQKKDKQSLSPIEEIPATSVEESESVKEERNLDEGKSKTTPCASEEDGYDSPPATRARLHGTPLSFGQGLDETTERKLRRKKKNDEGPQQDESKLTAQAVSTAPTKDVGTTSPTGD